MPILRSAKWLASTFSLSSHRQWYDVDAWLDSTLQITVFPQPMSWVVRSLFAGNYVGKVYNNKQIRLNARTWMNKAMFSSMLAMLVIWRIFSCGKHNFPNLCPSQWIFLWVVKQTIAYTSAHSVTICNPILTRLPVSTWVWDWNSSKIEGNLHNFVSWNCLQSGFKATDSLQIAVLFHLFWKRKWT